MFGYTNPPQPTTGRWVMVNSFSEIQNALVPIDGTQTLFIKLAKNTRDFSHEMNWRY